MTDEKVIQNLRFRISSDIAFGDGKRFISKQELENALGANFKQYKPLFEYLDKIDNLKLTEDNQIDLASFMNISDFGALKDRTGDKNMSPLGFVKIFENHKDIKKVNEQGIQEICENTGLRKEGILNFFNELFKIQMGNEYERNLKNAQNRDDSSKIGSDTEPVVLSTKINDNNTKEIISRIDDNNIQTKIVDMNDNPLSITTVDKNNNPIENKVYKYENDKLTEINIKNKDNINKKIKYEYINFNSMAEAEEYADNISSQEDCEFSYEEKEGKCMLIIEREEMAE